MKAFSSEITTGMSAPPIGSTTALPSSAAHDEHADEEHFGVRAGDEVDAGGEREHEQHEVDDLLGRRRSVIGRPGMISWSLPKAMFEPQKETEPTIAANSEKIAM